MVHKLAYSYTTGSPNTHTYALRKPFQGGSAPPSGRLGRAFHRAELPFPPCRTGKLSTVNARHPLFRSLSAPRMSAVPDKETMTQSRPKRPTVNNKKRRFTKRADRKTHIHIQACPNVFSQILQSAIASRQTLRRPNGRHCGRLRLTKWQSVNPTRLTASKQDPSRDKMK